VHYIIHIIRLLSGLAIIGPLNGERKYALWLACPLIACTCMYVPSAFCYKVGTLGLPINSNLLHCIGYRALKLLVLKGIGRNSFMALLTTLREKILQKGEKIFPKKTIGFHSKRFRIRSCWIFLKLSLCCNSFNKHIYLKKQNLETAANLLQHPGKLPWKILKNGRKPHLHFTRLLGLCLQEKFKASEI